MQRSEHISLAPPSQEWLDLRALTQYACVSERTVRNWIHQPINPLPAVQVGNKLLIKKSMFDEWVMTLAVKASESVNVIVDDVMRRMRG